MSGHPQAKTKGLGRYSLRQCQGVAGIWGVSGAPRVDRSRHWSKLESWALRFFSSHTYHWNPVFLHGAGLLRPALTTSTSTSTLFINLFCPQFQVQGVACL